MLERQLTHLLQNRRRQELSVPGRRRAAVLLPLYRHNGDYGLIFTQRSHSVPHHRGQIAFPGGAYEPTDTSLQATALRESCEEIGLQTHHVQVLGQLDDLLTSNSNYLVRPFVGVIPFPYPFTIDPRETALIIDVPLRFLTQNNPPAQELRLYEGRQVHSFFFDYGEHIIWGATARIVKQFIDLLIPLSW